MKNSKIYKWQKKTINKILTKFKNQTIRKWQKKLLYRNVSIKHKEILQNLQNKKRIKVVFLVLYKTMWKSDTLFKKMQENIYFEPIILVCPDVSYGDKQMFEDMDDTSSYFKNLGYKTIDSYDKKESRWITLDEIEPDILFFTRPHKLTFYEYYENAYLNYLSCYIPYHHEIGDYGDNIAQYNQSFHNAMWKIFTPHECSKNTYERVSEAKGKNVLVTGYPMMEELLEKKETQNYKNVWKNKDDRVRIIFAPHHTIESDELPYSNFLEYHEEFIKLAMELKDKVVWSFKPHPILRLKLNEHPSWGKDKTDKYYSFWQDAEFTQLDEGDYIDLFLSSDAMIHDSGSFLAEYLYAEKPVMYLKRENNNHFNKFGQDILKSIDIGKSFEDIRAFVDNLLLNKKSNIKSTQIDFFNSNIAIYFKDKLPSDKIIEDIKNSIKGKV